MDIPLDEVIYFDCIVSTPATGAAVDADSTPTFAVYEEATDTDIGVGGNLTKRTSLTGNYRGSFTASAANGFEAGKWYSVIASAVVGGVTGKVVARSFRIVASETVAGVPEVDVTHIEGGTNAVYGLEIAGNDYADEGVFKATDGSGAALATAASVAALPNAAAIATAVWAVVVVGSYTAIQIMRGLAAALLGKLSGAGTTTETFRAADDSKDVITATVDASGNRTTVTKDLT